MIIEEKGLVKAIKIAYRHGGYTVLNQGGEVTIYTEGWFVRCLWPKLPRKALATIVEHMGEIPEAGNPVLVQKDVEAQAVMPEVSTEDLAAWVTGDHGETVVMVPVIMLGYQIFQAESGACYGIGLTALGMIEPEEAEHWGAEVISGDRLMWDVDGERIITRAVRKSKSGWARAWERAVWDALESVDLQKEEGQG